MYNVLLSILAYILDFVGTVYAILSVLRMTKKEIRFPDTCDGIGNTADDRLYQRGEARIGIWFVFCGLILNCVLLFVEIKTLLAFGLITVIALLLVIYGYFAVDYYNDKYEEEYHKKYGYCNRPKKED